MGVPGAGGASYTRRHRRTHGCPILRKQLFVLMFKCFQFLSMEETSYAAVAGYCRKRWTSYE